MSKHGLEIFRGELPVLMDLCKKAAPFVDHFGLFSCCPTYTHGIVHDDEAEGDGYCEGKTGNPFGHVDAGTQCHHHGRMGRRHATGADEEIGVEFPFNRPQQEWFEKLGYESACEGCDQRSIGK